MSEIPKHTCETCVYERDSSPSQHCDCCVDGDNWRAAEPIKCPCEAYKGLEAERDMLEDLVAEKDQEIQEIRGQP